MNRISGAETKTTITGFNSIVINTTTVSTWNGNVQTLENTIKSAGSTSKTRELITYSNNLPVKVLIDTLSTTNVWGTKYKYTYAHEGGRVSNLKFYQLRGGMLSLYSNATFEIQNGMPVKHKILAYDNNTVIPDTLNGKYYFRNNRIDSIVEAYTDGYRNAKYVPEYNANGQVEKVDKYTSFIGDLMAIGSVWFYGTNALATMEEAKFAQLKVANPVKEKIVFLNSFEPLPYDLLDGSGKKLLSATTGESTDVSAFGHGVYFLSFKGTYGVLTKKIVIE
ncbi:MAG TPA: T9SS type A sorting domain-containing protein [Cytophagaceae bacterium]